MKTWTHALLAFAVALGMTGCFKSEAPQCSDPEVVKLVEQIYENQMQELQKSNPLAAIFLATLPKKIVKIESARPVKYDENVKLRSCKGIAHFEDNRTANIEYTVQLDEKNSDQFYVELQMDFLEGLAQQNMMDMIMNEKKQ
ncbi:hypothetical protein [Hydrogenimonas sp.]